MHQSGISSHCWETRSGAAHTCIATYTGHASNSRQCRYRCKDDRCPLDHSHLRQCALQLYMCLYYMFIYCRLLMNQPPELCSLDHLATLFQKQLLEVYTQYSVHLFIPAFLLTYSPSIALNFRGWAFRAPVHAFVYIHTRLVLNERFRTHVHTWFLASFRMRLCLVLNAFNHLSKRV